MNLRICSSLVTVLSLGLIGLSVSGQTAKLKVGDPAPKLQQGNYVQGEPVKAFEKDKAYIVEFWATWCGPCRESIPHLNETYLKYKDKGLVVIGQDCWEHDDALVPPFVKKMGDKMTYRVALDDKDGSEKGKMAETWMEASGQSGIPTAFLIDKKGTIAWIGHPMAMQPKTIDAVLAGTYDIAKAAEEEAARAKIEAQVSAIYQEAGKAARNKDWETALSKLDEAEKLVPAEMRDNLEMAKFSVLVQKGDEPAAYKIAGDISGRHLDEAMWQNALAWQLATDKHLKKPDLELAEKIADRADKASQGKEPGVIETVARVKFLRGKKEEAIQLQQKAVDLAESDRKQHYQKDLDSYKKGELPDTE